MAWTDEDKKKVVEMYVDASPTPDSSTEIIKEIAEELEQSPNGVRMILVQAGVYVKKEAVTAGTKTSTTEGAKTPRVSKESQIAGLRAEIEKRGAEVDNDILYKLTGKAAAYFVTVLQSSK